MSSKNFTIQTFCQVDRIAQGDADVGEIFDTTFEQAELVVGGATGAKAVGKKISSRKGGSTRGGNRVRGPRCRRSVVDGEALPQIQNIALPIELESKLPVSLLDIDLTHDVTTNTTDLVNSVAGVLLIIQLMISGHPKGKPYLDEICTSVYPTEHLEVRFQSKHVRFKKGTTKECFSLDL